MSGAWRAIAALTSKNTGATLASPNSASASARDKRLSATTLVRRSAWAWEMSPSETALSITGSAMSSPLATMALRTSWATANTSRSMRGPRRPCQPCGPVAPVGPVRADAVPAPVPRLAKAPPMTPAASVRQAARAAATNARERRCIRRMIAVRSSEQRQRTLRIHRESASARVAPALLDHGSVGGDPPAAAQVADEVPVHRGDVLAAGLGIRAAQREVDRAADLLVEEDRADRAVDAVVGAEAELAQAPRAVVRAQRLAQVGLAALGARLDHLAVAEHERDPGDVDPGRRRGDVEEDAPVGARLVRPGEDLARGHVALAVGVDPRAPGDAQRQVGPVGFDADLPRRLQPRDQRVLEGAQPAPLADRVLGAEEQRAGDEALEVGEAQAGLLGAGLRRPQRRAPALLEHRLAHLAAPAGQPRDALGVDARERARVLRRLDADRRVALLGLAQRQRRELVELLFARVRVEALGLPGQLDAEDRPGLALEDRALQLEQQGGREGRRTHEHLLSGAHVEAITGEEIREPGSTEGGFRRGRHDVQAGLRPGRRLTRSVDHLRGLAAGGAVRVAGRAADEGPLGGAGVARGLDAGRHHRLLDAGRPDVRRRRRGSGLRAVPDHVDRRQRAVDLQHDARERPLRRPAPLDGQGF